MINFWYRLFSLSSVVFFCIGMLFIGACSVDKDETLDNVLIEIKNKKITKNEFIKRAEYTIRPFYCRGNSAVEKKIVFNSLVAEKLFALEAGEDNELTQNEEFKTYMTGRLEQAMRQYFFQEKAYRKAFVPDEDVNITYKNSTRNYKVSNLTVDTEKKAKIIQEAIKKHRVPLDSLFLELTGKDNLPVRDIAYMDPDNNPEIEKALFAKSLNKGEIIGPIKTGNNEFVFLEIKGWNRSVSISSEKQQQDWLDVKEKMLNRKAAEIYQNEVAQIMSGKSVVFNNENFRDLVNLLGPQYVKDPSEIKENLKNSLFLNQKDREALVAIGDELDKMSGKELLTYDGDEFTIADFENELAKHPLVFRNPNFKKNQFAEQLKLAIIDMIRDREITRIAYELNYHENAIVKQNYSMWRDNLLAQFYKNELLVKNNIDGISGDEIFESVLNPHVVMLQKKYTDEIIVDIDLLNEINLTRVDMIALQREMPFPIVVPSFPQITNRHQLDYGVKKQ